MFPPPPPGGGDTPRYILRSPSFSFLLDLVLIYIGPYLWSLPKIKNEINQKEFHLGNNQIKLAHVFQ